MSSDKEMKATFPISLFLAFVIMVIGFEPVRAEDLSPHDTSAESSVKCETCHRSTVGGPGNLRSKSVLNLCLTCHGADGTGAHTNVEDGIYVGEYSGNLLGGGFQTYMGLEVTSKHDPIKETASAWGAGVPRGQLGDLTEVAGPACIACHDQHGNDNYRNIRNIINQNPVSVEQLPEAHENYVEENWGTGMSQICSACHTSYHRTSDGQGSLEDEGSFTHRIDMSYAYNDNQNPEFNSGELIPLPLATGENAERLVVCVTCHLPHGTSARTDHSQSDNFEWENSQANGSTKLLRADNRAVCQACHQK